MRWKTDRSLDPVASLRLLGLPEAASAAQIKRAYRSLAQKFHPDKVGSNEADRAHFVAISNAYRVLMQTARLVEKGKSVGRCCICHEFGEAMIGLDGLTRCPACALRPTGRLCLPLPALTVVKCVFATILLGMAVIFLIAAVSQESIPLAACGVIAGAGSVLSMAFICMRVVYCSRT